MRSNGWSMSSCARHVAFERHQLQVGELEQMSGLAARRRARVQHSHAVTHAEQLRRELSTCVLHRDNALVEAWNTVDRHRRGELDRVLARFARGNVMLLEQLQIGFDGRMPCVHAQRQWTLGVAGRQHVLPCFRPRAPHCVDPPCRVIPARHFVALRFGQQLLALA